MKRRTFIKLSGSMAASVLLPSVYALNPHPQMINIDNVIIGSGYGGAVTALRLCQAGHKCTILEMGVNWSTTGLSHKPFSNMLRPKSNSTWLKRKTIAPFFNIATFKNEFTGVLDRVDYENIKVYLGRGVGGGSLVNGGMAVTPNPQYFSEVFPDLNKDDFYNTYFPRAQQQLQINKIAPDFYKKTPFYKFARVGEAEAKKAGFTTVGVPNVYDFQYMEKEDENEVPRSAFNKELLYGNNYGKKSLDKSYLDEALKTGLLTILDLHRVDDIKSNEDGTFNISISVMNVYGKLVQTKTITCKKMFLSAGSIGTSKLLVAAKGKGHLPCLSGIGDTWGNNGNIMTGRNFVNTIFNKVNGSKVNNFDGIGTGASQSTIPVVAIDNWKDTAHPYFAEISPLPMGVETYTALYLLINKVPHKGKFYWDEHTKTVKLKWDKKQWEPAYSNAKNFIDKMITANGGTKARLLFANGFKPDICYHPLGGCVLGHATDNYGRIKGYKNLYAIDGSLVPGSIGVNPFLTITALAEYCIEHIIAADF